MGKMASELTAANTSTPSALMPISITGSAAPGVVHAGRSTIVPVSGADDCG